jgi:GNAT superfamily N-acetyltransferase
VLIRRATVDEIPTLEALQLRASIVWEEYRADLLARPELIELPRPMVEAGDVHVATDDAGHTLGFSAVVPGPDGAVELDGLFVDAHLQRGGIGRALIDDVVAAAGARGATRIEVTANPRALGFYEALGFVVTGEVPTELGPGIRMIRTL